MLESTQSKVSQCRATTHKQKKNFNKFYGFQHTIYHFRIDFTRISVKINIFVNRKQPKQISAIIQYDSRKAS